MSVLFSTSMKMKLQQVHEKFGDPVAYRLLDQSYCLNPNDTIHHITMRDNDKVISFCPKGKVQDVNHVGAWKQEGRQVMKIGKMVRMVLEPWAAADITDKDIEEFSKRMFITLEDQTNRNYCWRFFKGEDIAKWYNEDKYVDEYTSGITIQKECALLSSCMRDVHKDIFDMYVSNPDKVEMMAMVHKDSGLLMARALVWKLDDGHSFMDRVYWTQESQITLFQQYASEQGWYYKQYQSAGSNQFWVPVNDGYEMKQDIRLKVSSLDAYYEQYPYLDTLRYCDRKTCISNYPITKRDILLTGTDGEYITPDLAECACCKHVADLDHMSEMRDNAIWFDEEHNVRVKYKYAGKCVCSDCIVQGFFSSYLNGWYTPTIEELQVRWNGDRDFAFLLHQDANGEYGYKRELREGVDGKMYLDIPKNADKFEKISQPTHKFEEKGEAYDHLLKMIQEMRPMIFPNCRNSVFSTTVDGREDNWYRADGDIPF